jgi:Rps23 Pro-64 3,4-dihydroxylase Tpa1-like proline 4-hydroxylase
MRQFEEKKYYRGRQATDKNTIRRTHVACWMDKAADTHTRSEYTYSFRTATVVTQTRLKNTFTCKLPVLLYTLMAFVCKE